MPQKTFKTMWETILSGKIWRGVLSNLSKDKEIYFVDANIIPITDKKGTIKEFIAIRKDVTKQIKTTKKIQEKEKLIKNIFDNQDSIVIYASRIDGMISVNNKLFDMFNFNSFKEFRNKHDCICDLFLEEEGYVYPRKYTRWLDDIANNSLEIEPKAKIITRDNTIHTFSIKIKKNGENEYIINLYDVTDFEQAILKATASEQAKSIFLANMSHEIRTPLNGIIGFTDILKKQELNSDADRYVDIIHKSGQTLLNVVNDILDFSKIESGELRLSPVDTNLFKELEATVSTFSSIFKQKQISYYTYIDPSIPKLLYCDPQRIKQVLNNFISNAVKFTPSDGQVYVNIKLNSINNKNAKISFSVKDSGIGIPQEKIKTIFKAFSQADDSISREFGGTGLGLAISSQFIEMMDSKIEVDSQKGEGSEFKFDLELKIIDNSNSIQRDSHKANICVLKSENKLGCAINEIVFSYLTSWKYDYKEIITLDMIDDNTDIVIVCADLFDANRCKKVLDYHNKLQLIYIEGANESFNCIHKKFYYIEQPMTGSALFDKIITLTNSDTKLLKKDNILKKAPIYSGNILVAEDNETNQLLISTIFEERGINFTIVNNGQEAIDILENNDFDIIFMDINMPILDGISATKILRENGYSKPIVSLSANVIQSDKEKFLESGVDDTLNKPIVPDELDSVLNKYLNLNSKEDNSTIVYDILSPHKISKSLNIKAENIINKLFVSFYSTLKESILDIEQNGINIDNLHKLKGVVGNMRLENFYDTIRKIENAIDSYDEDDLKNNAKLIIDYEKNILSQLTLINPYQIRK